MSYFNNCISVMPKDVAFTADVKDEDKFDMLLVCPT